MGRFSLPILLAAALNLRLCASARLRSTEAGTSQNATETVVSATVQAPYRQTLHNYQNVQYFADFNIGGQPISGIFDTGSFELLVRSTKCSKCVHPTPPYNRELSHSYHDNGTMTRHVFGSGPCVSVMGYETVTVGHLHSEGQAFWEIVDHHIPVLDTAKFAAIVGIGPNFAFGNTEKTLLMSYGVDDFSICLQKPSGAEGYLTWGSTRGNLTASPDYLSARVMGKHHWATKLENVTFTQPDTGKPMSIPCGVDSGPCTAIIDSGTSLIAAPGIALMQLSEQIPEIKEDCSNIDDLPTLHFVVDGHMLHLPPRAYVMKVSGATLQADDVWDILFFKPKIRKLDMCMPAFMQIDMASQHGPVWILGMPFFRYFHTTFDRVNRAMHFAVAGPDCEPLPLRVNRTTEESLLAFRRTEDLVPMSVEVGSLIPPTLSGQMDFPFGNGEIDL